MQETRIDQWTKQLLATAFEELRLGDRQLSETGTLLGRLSQCIHGLVARDLELAAQQPAALAPLGEELAIEIYLTVAASASGVEPTLDQLQSMNRSLTRVLKRLAVPTCAKTADTTAYPTGSY